MQQQTTLNQLEYSLISNHFKNRNFLPRTTLFKGGQDAELVRRPTTHNVVIREESSDNNLLIVAVAILTQQLFFPCCATLCFTLVLYYYIEIYGFFLMIDNNFGPCITRIHNHSLHNLMTTRYIFLSYITKMGFYYWSYVCSCKCALMVQRCKMYAA